MPISAFEKDRVNERARDMEREKRERETTKTVPLGPRKQA